MPEEQAMQRASTVYPERYFELQHLFAQRITEVAQIPLAEVLLSYTSLYRLLGMGGKPDAASPDWQSYLREIEGANQPAALTNQIYLKRYPRIPKFTEKGQKALCF